MDLHPESQPPSRVDAEGVDTSKLKVSFDMVEDVLVFGVVGGFLHSLDFVDDPLFIEAADRTLGVETEAGETIPDSERVHSKVPMTLTGYALLDANERMIGFACFESQIR